MEVTMKKQFALIALVGALIFTACQPANIVPAPIEVTAKSAAALPEGTNTVDKPAAPVAQTESPAEAQGSLPPVNIGTPSPAGQKMALLSQADLSKRLNVSIDEITIKAVRPVVWPDSSLGCPEPDFAYSQIMTSGFKILLAANGQIYPYYTDDNERVILCLSHPPDEIFLPP
jgi:hypothetical protein